MNTITTNFSYTTLDTWPETPILSERSFSQRRLSMVCWFSETFIIRHYAL